MKDSGGIIKIVIIGGVAYIAYLYLQQSGMWAQWFGPAALPAGTGANAAIPPAGSSIPVAPQGSTLAVNPLGVPIQPNAAPTMTLADAMQILGNGYMQDNGLPGLSWDQWSYYYQQVTGKTIAGSQFDAMLAAAGVTRDQQNASAQVFLNALSSSGLSGMGAIIPVPNNGPALAPVGAPSMSFGGSRFSGRASGGFSAGMRGRNRGVQ